MSEQAASDRPYLPGSSRGWMMRFYDPMSRLLGQPRIHRELVDAAGLRPGQQVLEIGCGTGGLLRVVQRRSPGVVAAGLDPDPDALDRARRKLGPSVRLDRGFADVLPQPDASVDHVLSSFMWHHLGVADRPAVLGEIMRVLRPGGRLHLVDISGTGWMHHLLSLRRGRGHGGHGQEGHGHGGHGHGEHGHGEPELELAFDGHEELCEQLRRAGFTDVTATGRDSAAFGRVTFYRATRP